MATSNRCDYCGKDNGAGVTACIGCGTSLVMQSIGREERRAWWLGRHGTSRFWFTFRTTVRISLLLIAAAGSLVAFLFSVGLRPRKAVIPETFSQRGGPTFLTIAEPNYYSGGSLSTKLRQELTQEELATFVSPLASTPEMDAWAQQLVDGSTN